MDWKKNRLWIALGVLVALVAVVFVGARRGEDAPVAAEDELPELPDLTTSEIDELTIRRPGEGVEPVRLAKKDGVWRLVEPVDAEVEASTVQTALDKLGDLEVQRVAARNVENHAQLDVGDDEAIHVVARQAGETLVSLLVGAQGAGETMVRLEGQDPVLAVRGSLRFAFDREPKDWRNRKITDLTTGRVKEVELTYGETTRRFVRGEGDTWALAPGQPAIERFSSNDVNSIVSNLAQMRATDFGAPGTSDEAAGLATPLARAVLRYAPEGEGEGEADAEGEGAAAEAAPAALAEVVLLLGKPVEGEDGPHYLKVEGRDTLYQVTAYYAGRMRPTDEDLQDPEPGSEPPPAQPPPDLNVAGGNIPPEVLEQIQRQMAQQQGAP